MASSSDGTLTRIDPVSGNAVTTVALGAGATDVTTGAGATDVTTGAGAVWVSDEAETVCSASRDPLLER